MRVTRSLRIDGKTWALAEEAGKSSNPPKSRRQFIEEAIVEKAAMAEFRDEKK